MFYQEPARKIPVKCEVDVLVVGSGPAGIAAALAASRNGAKTMIIEQQNALGGISTTGLMSHWAGRVDSKIYREIIEKSAMVNQNDKVPNYTIDPEKLKTLYVELLEAENVRIQLYTFSSDVIVEDNMVKGVIVETKSGREAILAKVVIDASGDGDVAYKAGAEFVKGREDDGKMQPATVMFKVGGVDYEKAAFLSSFDATFETEKGELQALARKHLKAPAGHVLLYRSTLPGVVTCNMTNCIDIDGTNVEDLTKAELMCRKQFSHIVDFLREYAPGYENCYMISAASLMGIRETRHFRGIQTLTAEDILEAREFPDWVVRGAYFNFDVHNMSGSGLDKTGNQRNFKQKKGYTIPYGCLVPEKVDGLLLAGRNISGTHMAHSNYRVMPICTGIGEAAGVAAAVSIQQNCRLREVDVSLIQERLV